MKVQRLIIVSMFVAIVAGCATRYVERDVSKSEVTDNFGDVVVSQTSDELKKNQFIELKKKVRNGKSKFKTRVNDMVYLLVCFKDSYWYLQSCT